ncbi:twin-arginine translocase TatA/TatE family subunit [Myxococcus sp. K38C18041901]|uniref:twin-arginine translocase TatA/TatE family subunit n=1 Tax=Myxococcus guangdongensis TaxID=2906760 RepID=UPI0020A7632A|nr:twin-arginine translocase TatA/TatE family subunit [Myxococcus guangdongensis]MCP3062052.1 twin-arginine translocase TatA/TatE family subunit [Myxococcus guangdongensis]
MFNIGAGEMVLIAVAALLILGPQRLPELARAIGKFMREFRRQTDEVRNVVEREFYTMDHDLNREPPPPVRPTPTFPPSPAPQALPPEGMAQVATPVEPGAEPASEPAVEAPRSRAPLGLDGDEHPALPEPVAEAQPGPRSPEPPPAEPTSSPSSSAATESVGADGLPRLAPLPGTVARNAPKRS